MDSNKSIFQAAARFFSGTLISRFTGLCRDIAIAFAFGTSAPLAAFFTAFRLSHVPRRLFGEGGMQTAFIPFYEELKKESEVRAEAFFRDLIATLSLFLILFIGALGALSAAVFAYAPLSDGAKEIIYLTSLMLPGLLFICLYGLNASLLQCQGSYFIPGVAPALFNITWIAAVLSLSGFLPSQAMPYLAAAVTLASIFQWLATLPSTLKALKHISLFRQFRLFSPDVKKLARPLFLANLGIIAMQINSAIDPLFARFANPEGPAWLWYAIRVEQVPLALFGIALSGALLPPLSRAMKNNDHEKFHSFLSTALKKTSLLMIPLTIAIFLFGRIGIKLLFGYGDFGDASINGTTLCLWGYGLGLLPQSFVIILAPSFYAANDYKTPALASSMAVGVNLLLNSFFIFQLKMGPESVALATSLASWFNYSYLRSQMRLPLQTQPTP